MTEKSESLKQLESFFNSCKKLAAPLVIGGALLALPLQNSEAASSGGRGGGSSVRSSPSVRMPTRSYSSTRLYSSPSTTIIPVPVAPMISPFGFGYGYGLSPFSFMPINLNVLLLGGLAYGAYVILSNRISGSDFSESSGSMISDTTVLKVQIALNADWNEANSIMDTLGKIAARNNEPVSRAGLSRLLSEASFALLRRQKDWNAIAFEGEQLNAFQSKSTESRFQTMAVKERSKFEQESNPMGTMKGTLRNDVRVPTQAVVSLLVALRGSDPAYTRSSTRSVEGIVTCLQKLAAEALTDDGDNVLAVEVLWTPSEPGNVLTDRDVIEDYPELIRM